MIVTVSARCERLAAQASRTPIAARAAPKSALGNPPQGTRTWERPRGTRPREPARESAGGTRPAGASPTLRGRPVTGFSEPPLPVPVTVF